MVGNTGCIGIGVVLNRKAGAAVVNSQLSSEEFIVVGVPKSVFQLAARPTSVKVELDRVPQYANEFNFNIGLGTVTLTELAPIGSKIVVWF